MKMTTGGTNAIQKDYALPAETSARSALKAAVNCGWADIIQPAAILASRLSRANKVALCTRGRPRRSCGGPIAFDLKYASL